MEQKSWSAASATIAPLHDETCCSPPPHCKPIPQTQLEKPGWYVAVRKQHVTDGGPHDVVPNWLFALQVQSLVPAAQVPPSTSAFEHEDTTVPLHAALGASVQVQPADDLQHDAHWVGASHDGTVAASSSTRPHEHPYVSNAHPTGARVQLQLPMLG